MKNKYPIPFALTGISPILFNRPAYAGLFYNISLRAKNGVKLTTELANSLTPMKKIINWLTKVNNFSYNTLITNDLLLNNNNFQLMSFSPFSGYLRQYLTTLSDSGLNETIEKIINTELILAFVRHSFSEGGPFYPVNLVTSYPSPSARKIRPIPAKGLKNICEIFTDYQSVVNGDEKFLMIFLAQTGVNYTFAVPKKIVVGAPTAEIQARQAIKSKFNIQNETP